MSCRTERSSFSRTRVAEPPAGKLSVRSEKARLRARNLTAIGPAGRVGSLPRGAAVGRGWAGSLGAMTLGGAVGAGSGRGGGRGGLWLVGREGEQQDGSRDPDESMHVGTPGW